MNNITSKQKLIIISGPTAAGKTSLSIELAKQINGSIISADSMQVYKHMDIGSAKITENEKEGIKHYLIDILEPENDFNITLFKQYAISAIKEINREGKIPIVVGGTGFYIQALLYDIDFTEEASENTSIREELSSLALEHGNEYIHNILKEIDPKSAEDIHPNNVKRVIRAIEFFRQTGNKISDHNEVQHQNISPYNFVYFVITKDRENLYQNINRRVDIMVENGLIDEVKALRQRGLNKHNISMQGLGYKEILSYLDGEISLEDALFIIKRDTRHFAKKQLTWFKREKNVCWINKDEFEKNNISILEFMKEKLKVEGII